MLDKYRGVRMRTHASSDEAWISYIYSLFGSEILFLNEQWKTYTVKALSDQ